MTFVAQRNDEWAAASVASTLAARDYKSPRLLATGVLGDVAHTLTHSGHDASEDGTGRGTPVIAFSCKDNGRDATEDLSPKLRAMNFSESHMNGGGQVAVVIPILEATGRQNNDTRSSAGIGTSGDPMYTLQSRHQHGVVAYQCQGTNVGEMGTLRAGNGHVTGGVPFVAETAVRRLVPVECLRLQGFPDDHLDIDPPLSDSAKYRMTGNAVTVNVAEYIGRNLRAAIDAGGTS